MGLSRFSGRLTMALDRPLTARDAAAVFALALCLRLVNVWLMAGHDAWFQFPDSANYRNGAKQWLAHGSMSGYLGGQLLLPSERTPGYFWFLSGLIGLFGPSLAAVAVVQGVVDAGTCVLVGALARRLGPAPARIAGLAAAVWPGLIIHSALILQDTVFVFFLTSALVLLVEFARRPGYGYAMSAGLLFGLAFMTRAVILFLPLVVPIAMAALAWWRRRRAVPTVLTPIVFLLAMLVPLSPLVYRNVTAFGTIMPTTQSGLHALYWTITLIRMDQNGTTFDQESRRTRARFQAWLKARGVSEDKLGPFEADRLRRERALIELEATPPLRIAKVWLQGAVINLLSPSILSDARVRALPRPSFYATPGRGLFERAWAYFFADPGWFQVLVLLGLAGSLIAFALQIWGLVALFRCSRLAAVAAVVFVGYFLAISGPTAGPKYRMPFEPVMIVLFALGLEAALRRAVRRRQARDGGPGMPAGALPADGG